MHTLPTLIETNSSLTKQNPSDIQQILSINDNALINMSKTNIMDIYALSKILSTYETLCSQGKTLALINPSAPIRTLLYITKLHNIIPCFANLTMANQHIQYMVEQEQTAQEELS